MNTLSSAYYQAKVARRDKLEAAICTLSIKLADGLELTNAIVALDKALSKVSSDIEALEENGAYEKK